MIRKAVIVVLTLAAAAALALYISSRFVKAGLLLEAGESFRWRDDRTSIGCRLGGRYLVIWYNDPDPSPGSTWGMSLASHRFMGVKYVAHANSWGYRMVHFRISLWVLATLLAAYPAVALARGPLRRHRRRRKGLCLKCGYNLTGNVSGVCPECGHEI